MYVDPKQYKLNVSYARCESIRASNQFRLNLCYIQKANALDRLEGYRYTPVVTYFLAEL